MHGFPCRTFSFLAPSSSPLLLAPNDLCPKIASDETNCLFLSDQVGLSNFAPSDPPPLDTETWPFHRRNHIEPNYPELRDILGARHFDMLLNAKGEVPLFIKVGF